MSDADFRAPRRFGQFQIQVDVREDRPGPAKDATGDSLGAYIAEHWGAHIAKHYGLMQQIHETIVATGEVRAASTVATEAVGSEPCGCEQLAAPPSPAVDLVRPLPLPRWTCVVCDGLVDLETQFRDTNRARASQPHVCSSCRKPDRWWVRLLRWVMT
jgi:hypothetical protein